MIQVWIFLSSGCSFTGSVSSISHSRHKDTTALPLLVETTSCKENHIAAWQNIFGFNIIVFSLYLTVAYSQNQTRNVAVMWHVTYVATRAMQKCKLLNILQIFVPGLFWGLWPLTLHCLRSILRAGGRSHWNSSSSRERLSGLCRASGSVFIQEITKGIQPNWDGSM